MNAKLKLDKKDVTHTGVLDIDPDTDEEYLALKHWVDYAVKCGLPSRLINLQVPLWYRGK